SIDFLKRSPKDPFYLHLTYNAPHTPLQAPEEDMAVFRDRDDLSEAVKTLYAMIRRLDRNVGRLLEQIDQLGLRENTLIVFSSDNGPQFGGAGDDCLDRFNCQLHGSKGSTYEGGIRVPAILRWPAGLTPDQSGDNTFFHMCDWLPTILSLACVEAPEGIKLDGVDQSSALRGEGTTYNPKRCWQWNRYDPQIEYNAAIRDGDWKLVRPFVPEAFEVPDIKWLDVSMYEPEHFIENGIITDPAPEVHLRPPPPVELYNLKDDPLEQHNLASNEPQRVQQMQRELHAWFEDVCNDLANTRRM
nr:sulfatase-like hydrolase/transferase [Verrucomicrobiota bacterium]